VVPLFKKGGRDKSRELQTSDSHISDRETNGESSEGGNESPLGEVRFDQG